MIGKNEVSKALDGAFRAAFMLTGSTKAAIQRRPGSTHQSQQPPSCLPLELRRLFLLAPISRDCFVLRILLGLTPRTCSRILHLTIEEAHQTLCAALEALPFLEAGNSRGTRSIPLKDRARPDEQHRLRHET